MAQVRGVTLFDQNHELLTPSKTAPKRFLASRLFKYYESGLGDIPSHSNQVSSVGAGRGTLFLIAADRLVFCQQACIAFSRSRSTIADRKKSEDFASAGISACLISSMVRQYAFRPLPRSTAAESDSASIDAGLPVPVMKLASHLCLRCQKCRHEATAIWVCRSRPAPWFLRRIPNRYKPPANQSK